MKDKSLVDDDYIQNAIGKYADTIFRIALHYVRNKYDAEDVLQETLLSLLKQTPFENDEITKAWLIRVAINKSKDVLKSAKRRSLPLDETIVYESAKEGYEELKSALSKLPSTDSLILYLHYYEGYKAKEIGKILNRSEKAIHKKLSRSRQALKVFLEEDS